MKKVVNVMRKEYTFQFVFEWCKGILMGEKKNTKENKNLTELY